MNLQPINPPAPAFTCHCVACGGRVLSTDALADLDGRPFVDYYCRACAVPTGSNHGEK